MQYLEEAMTNLGYDKIWLEEGIVSSKLILKQYSDYLAQDKEEPIEHFRYSAFSKFAKRHSEFTFITFESLLKIAKHEANLSGPDTFFLAGYTLLKDHPGLTNKQLEKLLQATFNTQVYPHIKQAYMAKLIVSGHSDSALIEDCISNGNSCVIRVLLEHCGALKKSHIETIAAHGPSKAVRNLAFQKLKTLK